MTQLLLAVSQCGKTTFALQFITFEENIDGLKGYASRFGMDFDKLEKKHRNWEDGDKNCLSTSMEIRNFLIIFRNFIFHFNYLIYSLYHPQSRLFEIL